MTIEMIGSGPQNLIVFLLLAAFGVVAWFSIRRNIRGIDFDEVPSGPALKEAPTAQKPGDGAAPDAGTSAAPDAGTSPTPSSPQAADVSSREPGGRQPGA